MYTQNNHAFLPSCSCLFVYMDFYLHQVLKKMKNYVHLQTTVLYGLVFSDLVSLDKYMIDWLDKDIAD